MGLETPVLEGGRLCLATVGLDADATDQVRQAALQAQIGGVSAFPNYTETMLDGQLARRLKDAESLVCLIDFDRNKELAEQTASGIQTSASSRTTLIALSSQEDPDLILHAMRAGCTEYLTKPLQVGPLAELLRKLTERWLATVQRSHNRLDE